jgi:hypothetical protein
LGKTIDTDFNCRVYMLYDDKRCLHKQTWWETLIIFLFLLNVLKISCFWISLGMCCVWGLVNVLLRENHEQAMDIFSSHKLLVILNVCKLLSFNSVTDWNKKYSSICEIILMKTVWFKMFLIQFPSFPSLSYVNKWFYISLLTLRNESEIKLSSLSCVSWT